MLQEDEQAKKPPVNDSAFEKHYTVKEVSELWHLDAKMVREILRTSRGWYLLAHAKVGIGGLIGRLEFQKA